MDADGCWDVVIATPLGTKRVTVDISGSASGSLRGCASAEGETIEFSPTANGDRLSWSQAIAKPIRATVFFEVTVTGDTLSGTAKPGGLPSSRVTGSRRRP